MPTRRAQPPERDASVPNTWTDWPTRHPGCRDYLIAALTEGLELATLNIRHYPMFPELARPF